MTDKPVYGELVKRVNNRTKGKARSKTVKETFKIIKERYEKAEEICRFGHWSRDNVTNKGIWSKNVYRIFGVDPEKFDPITENFLRMVHPSDREFVEKSFNEAISQCKNLDIVYRIIRPDNSIRFIRSVAEPTLQSKARCTQLFGTVQDITEQKKAEEALLKSQQRFSTIFHSNPAAIAITRIKDNRLLDVNSAWGKKTGFSKEEAIDHTTLELNIWVNPEERSNFIKKLSNDGALQNIEALLRHKSGTPMYMLMSGEFVNMAGEECLITMGQDITVQKKLEKELREASIYNRNLIEASLDPLVTINSDGKIMDVNKATEVVTGISRENLIGSDFSDYFTDPEKAREGYRQVFLNGTVKDYPLSIRHSSGRITEVLYNAGVYRNKSGEVQGVFASARDITDRIDIEKERAHLQSELFQAQKMESLGRLVSGIAHEINNPINIITNNAPLLYRIWNDIHPVLEKHDKENPNLKYGGLTYQFLKDNLAQLISDTDLSANRIASIVQGLKDFSRKTSSSEKIQVDINTAVENALRLSGSTIRESGIKIDIELEKHIPEIMANIQNLEQIVMNLLMNAVQAIDHDHGYIRITTEYKEQSGIIVLTIEDNGKGIDPAIADKIYDPFFTERLEIGGTGLGLAIVKNLVNINNGDISFNSQKGKGTSFFLSFPTRPKVEPAKILIVDDDEGILKVMKKALSANRSYSIEQAIDGNEALIKMGTLIPDLLILDIFLPGMNGIEVIKAIRKEQKLRKMKILILTGYPEKKMIQEVAEKKGIKVLSKPLNLKDLLTEVREALEERV